MPNIYSKALAVFVWLGEDAEESGHALDLIPYINQQFKRFPPDTLVTYEALKDHEIPPPESNFWLAVGKIVQRPWFSRLWILQEIVLAKETIIICGANVLSWDELSFLWSLMRLSLKKLNET